jgi:hypothetical protein
MVRYERLIKAAIVIVLIFSAWSGKLVSFHTNTASIAQMNLDIQNSPVSQFPYQSLWFEVQSRTIQLNHNIFLNQKQLGLYALSKDGIIREIQSDRGKRTPAGLDGDFTGTFGAVLAPVAMDLNRDGVKEELQLVAKLDTLFTQGFVPVRTNFSDPRIPLEIVFIKNHLMKILFKGKPLANRSLRLISQRGREREIKTDVSGSFIIHDLRDLARGISVVYLDQKHSYYITSYMRESYSVLSSGHWLAMIPLFKVMAVSAIGIILLLLVRKYWPGWRLAPDSKSWSVILSASKTGAEIDERRW